MSRVSDTATAMLAVLAEHDPDPVLSADMRSGVAEHGGYPSYIPEAARALRQQGTALSATKARHLSTYRLLGDASGEDAHRRDEWERRVRKEALSEMTTQAAALGRATSNGAIHARSRIIGNAISLGVDLGMSHTEVLALCDPASVNATP